MHALESIVFVVLLVGVVLVLLYVTVQLAVGARFHRRVGDQTVLFDGVVTSRYRRGRKWSKPSSALTLTVRSSSVEVNASYPIGRLADYIVMVDLADKVPTISQSTQTDHLSRTAIVLRCNFQQWWRRNICVAIDAGSAYSVAWQALTEAGIPVEGQSS